MMTQVFIWKKLYMQVIEHTNNYFHISFTTASNLNKLKNYMIFCHLKLPWAPTQDKFLDFLQHDFSKLNLFQKTFFIWMGGKRVALARARRARTPIQVKKVFWKRFSFEKSCCKKSRNLSWVGAHGSFKWQKCHVIFEFV